MKSKVNDASEACSKQIWAEISDHFLRKFSEHVPGGVGVPGTLPVLRLSGFLKISMKARVANSPKYFSKM